MGVVHDQADACPKGNGPCPRITSLVEDLPTLCASHEDFQGGQFLFEGTGGADAVVEPRYGRLVAFSSDAENPHKALESRGAIAYSNTWREGRRGGLKRCSSLLRGRSAQCIILSGLGLRTVCRKGEATN